MGEKAIADVPLSFLEYRALFREPIIRQWGQPGEIVSGLFEAFREWNVSLESVSGKQSPASLGEIQTNFGLLNGKVTFQLGLGSAVLVVLNPDWTDAGTIVSIASASLKSLATTAHAEVARQKVTLSMHLIPRGRSLREITSKFLYPGLAKKFAPDLRVCGFSIYRDGAVWVTDASASHTNGLFVRIMLDLDAGVQIDKVAESLRAEEDALLDILDLGLE